MSKKILLGFEMGTGKPVEMPLNHTIVVGMTQLSGKTTTLEALLSRSKLTALTFRTKRGELGFKGAHPTPLFFNEQGLLHWQALEGLLDSTLQEKVRKEPGIRAALMNLSGGAISMQDIYSRNDSALANPKIRGFMRDVHTKLKGYFDLIIPQLKALQPRLSNKLELRGGLNLMNLEGLNEEMQALLIAAATTEIHMHREKTIIVIPEAWKFLPEGRGSPCKLAVLRFVKEGAIIGNYLWGDTQDVRSLDKQFTRMFDNWVMGRQKDRREIDEMMEAIPLPKRERPPAEEIKQFPIGVFLACLHNDVKRVYVQPAWLSEKEAKRVALGYAVEIPSNPIKNPIVNTPEQIPVQPAESGKQPEREPSLKPVIIHSEPAAPPAQPTDAEPGDARVVVREPVAGDRTREPTLKANDQEVTGQILYVAKQDALDGLVTSGGVIQALSGCGWIHPKAAVDQALLKLCDLKFFTRKMQSNEAWGYRLTPNAKDRIILELVNAV